MSAESLVKHTACLRWVDRDGRGHAERHAAWTPRRATSMAYARARSMKLSGEARAFRIEHHEQVICESSASMADAFALPAMPAGDAA